MSKWEQVQLDSICEILDNKRIPVTAKNRISGIYPYYGANGVQDYINDYIFDDELVLVAEDGGNFGSKDKPIAYRVSGKCWVNNHAHVLKSTPLVNIDYLCFSLMFYDVSKIVNGATRQKLNQADLRKMSIPLPPLSEQIKISENLDKVTKLIDICNKSLEKLDLLVKARFVEMFGDPVENPMGWEVKALKDVCSKITDGTHFSPPNNFLGKYKYITAKNIKYDGFDLSNLTYISEDKHNEIYSRCNPEYGDILYIKDGVTTGVAMINTLDEEFSLLSSVALLKYNKNIINNIFLCLLLNNNHMYKSIRSNMGGAAITRLTIVKIKELKVLIPPRSLQNQFAEFVEQTDKSKQAVKKCLEKAEMLKSALMQEYFE